jgi:hypothetical protein
LAAWRRSVALSIGIAVRSGKGHDNRRAGGIEASRIDVRQAPISARRYRQHATALARATGGAFLAAMIIANAIGAFVAVPLPFWQMPLPRCCLGMNIRERTPC